VHICMYIVNITLTYMQVHTHALLQGNAHVHVCAWFLVLNTCIYAFLKAEHILLYLPVSDSI
jgi:hypothetical protein